MQVIAGIECPYSSPPSPPHSSMPALGCTLSEYAISPVIIWKWHMFPTGILHR
jgi:hypothetical protein